MKKTNFYLPLLFISAVIAAGCGKAASTTTAADDESKVVASVAAVSAVLDSVSGISDQAIMKKMKRISKSMGMASLLAAPNFGADWTSSSAIDDPLNNPSESVTVSFQEFFGKHLDSNALTRSGGGGDEHSFNALGRMKSALGILCALGVGMNLFDVAQDENGYPTASFSFTFNSTMLSQMVSKCGFDASAVSGMLGQTANATVVAASNNYDVKISFDMFDQDYYYRSNSTSINIMTAEVSSGGPTMRTILLYDKATKVMRVDYASVRASAGAGAAGLEAHRLYYDETNDDGVIFTMIGQSDATPGSPTLTTKTMFTIAGKPETGTGFSVSGRFINYNAHAKYEACVDSDGDMNSDGARCSATSTTTVGADVDTVIAGAFADVIANQAQTDWRTGITDSTGLSWTNKTNMVTGAFY